MAELWKTTGTRGDSSGGDTMEEAGETRFDPPEAPWGEHEAISEPGVTIWANNKCKKTIM